MSGPKPYFSKSKLIAAWQCQKKLYLDKHHPDLADNSDDRQAIFDVGHRVGKIAQDKYGTTDSVEISYSRDSSVMLKDTNELLAGGIDFPVFEATFEHEGVLIRADVMIPEGDAWHVIEVKSGASVKDVNKFDAAIQLWVLRGAGLSIKTISLAYIDNQFEYQGDGDYDALIKKEDVTEVAEKLQRAVAALVVTSAATVMGDMPDVPVGTHCAAPYACEFQSVCWPTDGKYPIIGIRGAKKDIFAWVNKGLKDIRDIPANEIKGAKREWIYRVTKAGKPEVLAGAKELLEALLYPRYYLDFETTGPAVPLWKGTRPYKHLPVQWSVHIDDGKGDGSLASVRHEEFLDLSGEPPMRALAESLIECLGDSGPVFEYTTVEERVIRQLAEMFPDLQASLLAIVERVVDLADVAKQYYYHPDMLGSWSLKYIGPSVASSINYKELGEVNEGMAAANFFLEAIHLETTPDRKADLEKKLLKYCWMDTAAMVEIARFFSSR
jgi:CRISPR/Cas system-associated exonuclease Cas4 (RecB family)